MIAELGGPSRSRGFRARSHSDLRNPWGRGRQAGSHALWLRLCQLCAGGLSAAQLTFADIPVAGSQGPIGSALGGTGLAISKHAANKEAAIDYAYWVMSADVQRGPYAGSGGQPGHAVAWEDPAVNAATGNFYRNTRATLEGAYVRPRHGGLHRIQEQGGRRLNDGLLAGEQPDAIVSALNRLFKESFR